MILKIQKSRSFKVTCVALALNIFFELVLPRQAFALTGGPAQPEFGSFTPIGTSDMVDLSSGDFNYNLPLMDVGGYPLNLAYSGSPTMDQEASHVGLGWNLSVGQINRNVRGIPDDFDGDELTYENHLKPNVTVGLTYKFDPGFIGIEADEVPQTPTSNNASLSASLSIVYNNYNGLSVKPGINVNKDFHQGVSVGFSAVTGPDGLSLSPSVSLHSEEDLQQRKQKDMSLNLGVSMNSRQGLSAATLSMVNSQAFTGEYFKVKNKNGSLTSSIGSTISFTDPVYTPTKRVGMETGTFTLNADLGGLEMFGGELKGEITAFGSIMRVKDDEKSKKVPAYGYSNTEKANKYSILDFNREKDGAFSKNTTNLPVTNYTYDIYSVQGQGVSGTYRPYRNQVGYVYDAFVQDGAFSGSLGLEAGTGSLFNLGVDIQESGVESHSGVWSDPTGIQKHLEPAANNSFEYEKVHFKNVGDLSADEEYGMFSQQGSYHPVMIPLTGYAFNRKTQSQLNLKIGAISAGAIAISAPIMRQKRQHRNQAIYNITKAENAVGIGNGPLAYTNINENYTLPTQAKDHHTTEVQITRNDGARYVYGLPAYNTLKKEASFSVKAENGDCANGLVTYDPASLTTPSTLPNNQFLNRVTTPGYVHTHLLTAVLSTDYQDISGDGPTADDLGSYTKFSYDRKDPNYKWRVPMQVETANYDEGLKTDTKDDQGNYVYGEKELYYIDKIETKTHVAIFHYSERKDAKGVDGEAGGMNTSESMYKLDKISLYSIGEYDDLGTSSASTPIKEVYFEYSYSLCPDVPNNAGGVTNEISNHGGKLTLKKVYFQYRNSAMGKYTGYRFNYGEYAPISNGNGGFYHPDEYSDPTLTDTDLNTAYVTGTAETPMTGLNPSYNIKGYDSWGNYLPNAEYCGNTDPLTAPEFPFVDQNKAIQDNRASVWCMRKIHLPSGGTISVDYESDDYAFVQNKEVLRMFKVVGAGNSVNAQGVGDQLRTSRTAAELYRDPILNKVNRYLYIEVDDDATSLDYDQYIKGLYGGPPIYFRFLMNTTMVGGTSSGSDPAKYDYVTGYFEHEETATSGQIFEDGGKKYMSLPVKLVDKEGGVLGTVDVHPISKATWSFGRKYLNNHVYSNQPNGDTEDIATIVTNILTPSVITNLYEIFSGPNATLENKNIGRQFIAGKSWVRLNTLHKSKLGGGNRVKKIQMSDVWESMNIGQTGYKTMNYGQEYAYKLADGTTSGVATYEPVGNKENPFVQPVFTETKNLLAPDDHHFVEKPFGESFFPNAQITYSRVSVQNIDAGTNPNNPDYTVKKRNKTGKVVTEFYTSKDYPTIVDQTIMEPIEDRTPWITNIFNLITKEYLTMSQGYVIHLNDMNGKQKSQRVYAEGQTTAISGVDYNYRMHSGSSGFTASSDPTYTQGRLNNEVKVINPDGSVGYKTIGVETDLVVDYRENETHSFTIGVNTNLSAFVLGIVPIGVPMLLPDISYSDDQFHSVSTTKVINTFGLLEETVAYDAGAAVYTKNLAWDAVTGEVLVTETVDEYNDKYYTFSYPSHWYYKGMAQAVENLGLEGDLVANGSQYSINGITQASKYLIPGDELYIEASGASASHAWVTSVQGNSFSIIDKDGANITGAAGKFEVIRSGHRNLQSAGVMNVTLMHNPLTDLNGVAVSNLGIAFLKSSNWEDWKIINAGAVDYSQKWKFPCECGYDNSSSASVYNPYVRNERGVWRTKSSRTYLTGRNTQDKTTPRQEGFFTAFSPMYQLTNTGSWYKDMNNWTFVAEVSKYSPYGFELENRDALNRYSAAQYGYNNVFPMAVGANTEYRQIGFDGFEDYLGFENCDNAHFSFRAAIIPAADLSEDHSHTGKYSLKVPQNSSKAISKSLGCVIAEP